MADMLTPQERAAIAEALSRIPADQRRVPIGATAYPPPVWDGSKLAYRDADRRRREALSRSCDIDHRGRPTVGAPGLHLRPLATRVARVSCRNEWG